MFFKIARYNFKMGIIFRYKLYIIFAIFITLQLLFTLPIVMESSEKVGFMDLIIYIFSGSTPFVKDVDKTFQIPIIWCAFILYISYINQDYLLKDRFDFGQLTLIQMRSRINWWLGKCFWLLLNLVILFCILCVVTALFVSITSGDISFLNNNTCYLLSNISVEGVSIPILLFTALLMPFVCMFAISILQFLIQLFIDPIISYIFVGALTITSVYFDNNFFFLNGMMMKRNILFSDNGSINSISVLLIASFISFVSFGLGAILFRKYDILKHKKGAII